MTLARATTGGYGNAPRPWRRGWLQQRRRESRQYRHQPLVLIAAAAGAGMLVDRHGSLGLAWLAMAAAGLVAWRFAARRPAPRTAPVCLLAAVAAAGAAWHHANWRLFDQHEISRWAGDQPQPLCFEGVALDAPRRRGADSFTPLRAIPRGETTQIPVRATRVRVGPDWRRAGGEVDVVVDGHLLAVHAGDSVRVFGQIRGAAEPRNPGVFDFAAAARSDRRLARVRCESPDCVVRIETVAEFGFWRWLGDARLSIEDALRRQLRPDQASVAAAMLIGSRSAVARDRAEQFRRTGLLHLLVVSGLHVAMVVAVFYSASRMGWFPRCSTLLIVMALILVYALICGARAPVVRAAVLAEMICLAAITGRPAVSINSLGAAVLVILALNPAELFRSGTQLSFIAAATLIVLGGREPNSRQADPMQRLLASVEPWPIKAGRLAGRASWWTLMATLAMWITTAPLLLYRFHMVSPISLPMSVVVFPLVGVLMVSGLLLIAADFLLPIAAAPLAGVCGGAIGLLESLVQFADNAPLTPIWSSGPPLWWTAGAYSLLGAPLLLGVQHASRRWVARSGAAWLAIGCVAAAVPNHGHRDLRCSFIALGHGCSVLIETPDGANLLYDAGSLGSPEAGTERIAGVLWSKGINRIDALVLSHADVDHFNAAPGLMERFSVGQVYTSDSMFTEHLTAGSRSAPAELRRAIDRHGIELTTLSCGDRRRLGALELVVLHPRAGARSGSDNARSLVVALEYEGRRVLLPGDLEGVGIQDVMTQPRYDCDLLLAPHHGSQRSDPPGFAAWSSPELVVVSGGSAAYSESAGVSYAAHGARVLRTVELGMIECSIGSTGITARGFLAEGTGASHSVASQGCRRSEIARSGLAAEGPSTYSSSQSWPTR